MLFVNAGSDATHDKGFVFKVVYCEPIYGQEEESNIKSLTVCTSQAARRLN